MKSLSIYIDKWFMSVAVNTDGNVKPLTLPNGEDRIWLFFHEDTANSRIIYGKSYEDNFRDRTPHFLGDIFHLLESGEAYFTRYQSRREEMREIFKVSHIFHDLHAVVDDDNAVVDTYLSFSPDISDLARCIFIEEMNDCGFHIIESAARLSHLALEDSRRRGRIPSPGHYLVLSATNDNLHYSLYEYTENIFLRKDESSLPGYGLDVRSRALVEYVVENVNKTSRLLSTQKELIDERKRQERNAAAWLRLIDKGNRHIPISLPDITFAVAPNNKCAVSVIPRLLDDRTKVIVEEIVRKIAEFIKNTGHLTHDIKGIVFIGNPFANTIFSSAIRSRFVIGEDMIISYRDCDLHKVVSIYPEIDCSQFDSARLKLLKNAEKQKLQIEHAREEEKRRKEAQEASERVKAERNRSRKAEQDYAEAMDKVNMYERASDYEQMKEWAIIALTHRPDDASAKEKCDIAQTRIAERDAHRKLFHQQIKLATNAYNEKRWQDAINYSDQALLTNPDSEEASRIKTESKKRLDILDKIRGYMTRVEVFFAQKLYSEALNELDKIFNLDKNNTQAIEFKQKITELLEQHEDKIRSLKSELDKSIAKDNIDQAIEICKLLIEEDVSNIGLWTSKRERLKHKKNELNKVREQLEAIRKDIDSAFFEEDWVKMDNLCCKYLELSENEEILRLHDKALKKIEAKKNNEQKEIVIARFNSCILEKNIPGATKELQLFKEEWPMETIIIKSMRKKLFEIEESFPSKSPGYTRSEPNKIQGNNNLNPVGFTLPDIKQYATDSNGKKMDKYTRDDFNF